MDLTVIKGGKFTFTLQHSDLVRGVRPSARSPRNQDYLSECIGAIGRDGVLSALDSMTRLNTSTIIDPFPFPQIFLFAVVTIVCGHGKIYEWNGSSLTLKYTAATKGGLWCAVDFHDYIYLSNGAEAVVRDAGSKTYAIDTDLPTASCMCNFNGQVMIGAPNTNGLGANLMFHVDPATITMSNTGTLTTV